jgi:hypothetical protein
VTIVFGQPFSGRDLLPADEREYPAAVRALTERIAAHMRRHLVEADPRADAALVDRVDRLYATARERPADAAERLIRRRTIAAGMERLRQADAERYDAVLLRLRRYDQRLQRFGLRDRHLDWQISTRDVLAFATREIALGVVLLPLCVVGLVAFFVPYKLTGIVAQQFTRERDVLATAQVLCGAAIYTAWLALTGAIVWLGLGRTAGLVSVLVLPLLAVASLFALERESAVIEAVRAWWLLRRARSDTRERLRRSRSELADVLDEVHKWLQARFET